MFDAIGILNQCLHRREPGRGEIADIRNWIRNLADHDLTLYLDKLYTGGNDNEILIHGRVFLDNVYALLCVHITTTCGEMMMTLILLTSPPPRQNRMLRLPCTRPRPRLMRGMKPAMMRF